MKNIIFLITGIGLVILYSSANAADVTRLTLQPETETTAQIEALIKSMDKNKNGKIEFDEMYGDGIISAYQFCKNAEKIPVLSDVDSAKFTNICTLYNFKEAMIVSIIVNGKALMEKSQTKSATKYGMSFLKQEGIDLKDIVNGELRFRNVYLSPNLYGRKIRIEYPSNWTQNQDTDTIFIDDFLKDIGLTRRCVLHITKEDVESIDAEWSARFALFKYAHDVSGNPNDEITILESRLVEIDTLPGLLTTFEHRYPQQSPTLYSKSINLMTGYKNTMITLSCLATSDNPKDSAELFETSKDLFLDIIRSFKCLDMWESYEAR